MRILLLFLTVALAIPTRADILVYKGSGTCLLPHDKSQFSKTPHFYYIVDFVTGESFPIFYFTLDGQKHSQGRITPVQPTHYIATPGPREKSYGSFSFAYTRESSVFDFDLIVFYFRGQIARLQTSDTAFGLFPRTLTGIYRATSNDIATQTNDEINFVLAYDAFHTQAANKVHKTGLTAASDILAELADKGFQ